MIYDAVKTQERAKELVEGYVAEKSLTGGHTYFSEVECECGQTSAFVWSNGEVIVSVAICDCCGDDSAFASDVVNVE
jgi:hypothetical protein